MCTRAYSFFFMKCAKVQDHHHTPKMEVTTTTEIEILHSVSLFFISDMRKSPPSLLFFPFISSHPPNADGNRLTYLVFGSVYVCARCTVHQLNGQANSYDCAFFRVRVPFFCSFLIHNSIYNFSDFTSPYKCGRTHCEPLFLHLSSNDSFESFRSDRGDSSAVI